MSMEPSFDNPSYISCEIDGTQYLLEKLPEGDCETEINLLETTTVEEENALSNRNGDSLENNASVPLVCLDGKVFAVRNGELQEIDLNQLITLNDNNGKVVVLAKDYNNENPETALEEYNNSNEESPENVTDALIDKDCLEDTDIAEVVSAFKCKICSYTTQDKNILLQHFQCVHLDNNIPLSVPETQQQQEVKEPVTNKEEEVRLVYLCGQCSDGFATIDGCKEHMINVHCLESNTKTNSKDEINETDKYVGNDNSSTKSPKSNFPNSKQNDNYKERYIKCKYRNCPYKFTTTEKMIQHVACHIELQGTNYFKCSVCKDLKFPKWRPCSLHMWKDHQIDIDLFTCSVCKAYKSATLVKLMTHMKVHSENREYQCLECGKCFKQSSQLRNHRVMHLDRKSSDVSRWYTSKKCETCGKTYADSKCLKNHIQAVHSKLKPFVCNVCGHSCARKAMLQMHLRQHTGDKPFSCHICEYKTGDHNSLRRHIMRHTGDRPYKCPHCPYSAIQSNSYKNHLRSKHPLQSGVFICDLCPFKTVRNETFTQHMELHSKGVIKKSSPKKDKTEEKLDDVFPGNIAAAQLIYSCLGAFSKVGKSIKANLMSSCTSADGTSQTITIQIPSKYLEGTLPTGSTSNFDVEQEDDETMHCFLKIPREEEENVDTGGITIPAEPE